MSIWQHIESSTSDTILFHARAGVSEPSIEGLWLGAGRLTVSRSVGSRYTPFNTHSGETGQFRLAVAAGTYDLGFSHPGYRRVTVSAVEVGADQSTILPDVVELEGALGRIHGAVAVPPGFDGPAIWPEVTVALRDHAAALEEPEIEPLGELAPGPEGLFVFEAVAPGTYRLDVTHPDFAAAQRVVQVGGGQDMQVGTVALTAERGTDDRASVIAGVARLQGAPDSGHARIRIDQSPTTVPSNSTTSPPVASSSSSSWRGIAPRPNGLASARGRSSTSETSSWRCAWGASPAMSCATTRRPTAVCRW